MEKFKVVQMLSPHDNVIWVEISVRIKNNKTSEVVEFIDTGIFDEENSCLSTYIWEDGNYSCDCNRGSFFYGEKNMGKDVECGCGGFSVNIYNPQNKELLYKEFEEVLNEKA